MQYFKNVIFISPFQEHIKYLQKYVNVFYIFPRHLFLASWYIHRLPAKLKSLFPYIPDKLMISQEYFFNPPHKINKRISKIEPSDVDAIIMMDPTTCNYDFSKFKKAVRIYWSIDHVYKTSLFHDIFLEKLEKFDYTFVSHKEFLPFYSNLGTKSYWLPLYYDPMINMKIEKHKDIDISFVGNIYGRRGEYVKFLKDKFPKLNTFYGNSYGKDMNEIYNRSKIVLNFANVKELNFRVFEALGSGAFVLNEYSKETLDIFENNIDLATFFDLNDLSEKIQFYLEHDKERETIALSGHNKVKQSHTLDTRIKDILEKTGLL